MSHSSPQSIPSAAPPAESGNTATTKQKDGLSASAPAFVPRPVDSGDRQQQHGRGHKGPHGGARQDRGGLSRAINNRDQPQSQHQQHHNQRGRGHHRPQSAAQRPQPQQRQPGAELSNQPNQQQDVEPSSSYTTTPYAVGSSPDGSGSRGATARGRAVAANHLLNFQYDTGRGLRGGRGGRGPGSSASHGSNSSAARRRYQPPRPQRYDKQKFLQANFRFLVSSTLDRRQYESDADRMFDWDDVILVDMMSATPIQCPISLESPPICPQITPCGHVYSFGSIMQHLMNHGGEQLRRSAPCPLCYQPVVARELRLVQVRHVEPVPTVGSTVTFQLLRRPRTSIIPTAVTAALAGAADADTTAAAAASSPGSTPTSKWKAPAAPCKSSSTAGSPAAAPDASSLSTPLSDNLFAKFATCSDPRPLWRASAQQLGEQLALILSQGGTEAHIEAPAMFAAADALAHRARRFAEHQSNQLQQRGVPGATVGAANDTVAGLNWPVWLKQDPHAAGADAEQLVRDAFTLALDGSKAALVARTHKQQVQQRIQQEFPELAAGTPARPAAVTPLTATAAAGGDGGRGGGLASAWTAQQQTQLQGQQQELQRQQSPPSSDGDADDQTATELHFDHAFSEDEEGDNAEQQQQQQDGQEPAGNSAASTAAVAEQDSSDAGQPGKFGSRAEAAQLYGSSPGSSHILGSSPNSSQLAAASQNGDYYMYQSADGQWLFLHPLNLRCLLHAYGSYETCPPAVMGQVLEIDDLLQDEASRRRWKFLGHLPLTGTFRLAEVQLLNPVLTAEQLAPFAEELSAREKRRKRRADAAARESRREAAAAAAAHKARQGPTAAELRAMPKLGSSQGALVVDGAEAVIDLTGLTSEQIDEALAAQVMHDSAALTGASPPSGGVSFAKMTKLGFAASGPALGAAASPGGLSEEGLGPSFVVGATPTALKGAWGASSSVGQSAAARLGGQASSSAPKSAWGASSSHPASSSSVPQQAGLPGKSSWAVGTAAGRDKAAAAAAEGASSSTGGAANWLVLGGGGGAAGAAAAPGGEGDAPGAEGESHVAGTSSASKKGKKEKKTMLFTTGAQRKY